MQKPRQTILPPFLELRPELLDEWHYDKNVDLDPKMLSAGSSTKVWWRCNSDATHEWLSNIRNRVRKGHGCPYCKNQVTDPKRSIATLFPQLMEEWHLVKNDALDPMKILPGSQRRAWWQCKDGHEWDSFIFSRTKNDLGCPECRGRIPSEKNSLATIFPDVAVQWHPTKNKDLTPKSVTSKSGKKVWWKCRDCLYEWRAEIKNRTHLNSHCPMCSRDNAVVQAKRNKLERVDDFLPDYSYDSEERLFLRHIEIQEIFKRFLKIESEPKTIDSLFSPRNFNKINYDPYYQRKYVWDKAKAAYFIESILIGTEVPPLVFYESSTGYEVIDGRQRFETLKRFHDNEIPLTPKGLYSLKALAGKSFADLDDWHRDFFFDTKIRIIKFTVVDESRFDIKLQDLLKKEIFRRYNSGITPLRRVEVEKAIYIRDKPTNYFKEKFKRNKFIYQPVVTLFLAEKESEQLDSDYTLEKAVQAVRFLLLASEMPIMSARQKNTFEQFYDRYSEGIQDIQAIYKDFGKKIRILSDIKDYFQERNVLANRYWYQTLYWGLSVLAKEGVDIEIFNQQPYKDELLTFFQNHTSIFTDDDTQFMHRQFFVRYNSVADFLAQRFNLSLGIYIRRTKVKEHRSAEHASIEQPPVDEDDLMRIDKQEAVLYTIDDLCRTMLRRKFILRPVYQRGEVINRTKSSAIIESILLGIKLPPLYIFKREDGLSEVIDGQQRLLSILGFMGQSFMDETGKQFESEKNEYTLTNLRVLDELNGKKHSELSDEMQNRILDFPLSLIIIDEKFNHNFDPVDLFIRLNNRPYPIKENTFEMWNSYVDKEIIDDIKALASRYESWFYLTRNNVRMKNEELVTILAYLEYRKSFSKSDKSYLHAYMDIFQRETNISVRIKQKSDVTRLLNQATIDPKVKSDVRRSVKQVDSFIRRLKTTLIDKEVEDGNVYLDQQLTALFNAKDKRWYARKFLDFYALWYLSHFLNTELINTQRVSIKSELTTLLSFMKTAEIGTGDKDSFVQLVTDFQQKYALDADVGTHF